MNNKKCFELSDEDLNNVVGGIDIGNRVKVNSRMVQYCPQCGNLATVFYGTVVDKMYYEKGGYYIFSVQSDCCGYVGRAVDYACSAD